MERNSGKLDVFMVILFFNFIAERQACHIEQSWLWLKYNNYLNENNNNNNNKQTKKKKKNKIKKKKKKK